MLGRHRDLYVYTNQLQQVWPFFVLSVVTQVTQMQPVKVEIHGGNWPLWVTNLLPFRRSSHLLTRSKTFSGLQNVFFFFGVNFFWNRQDARFAYVSARVREMKRLDSRPWSSFIQWHQTGFRSSKDFHHDTKKVARRKKKSPCPFSARKSRDLFFCRPQVEAEKRATFFGGTQLDEVFFEKMSKIESITHRLDLEAECILS